MLCVLILFSDVKNARRRSKQYISSLMFSAAAHTDFIRGMGMPTSYICVELEFGGESALVLPRPKGIGITKKRKD